VAAEVGQRRLELPTGHEGRERVDGAGDFLTEEAPNAVSRILIDWLESLSH
jgi:hypothetical protein